MSRDYRFCEYTLQFVEKDGNRIDLAKAIVAAQTREPFRQAATGWKFGNGQNPFYEGPRGLP